MPVQGYRLDCLDTQRSTPVAQSSTFLFDVRNHEPDTPAALVGPELGPRGDTRQLNRVIVIEILAADFLSSFGPGLRVDSLAVAGSIKPHAPQGFTGKQCIGTVHAGPLLRFGDETLIIYEKAEEA